MLDTLLIEFQDMVLKVAGFVPTLFKALGILFIGYIFAHLIDRIVTHVLKTIHFDMVADKMGITKVLKKGGIRQKPSSVIGCLSYWVLMFMVLIMSVKALGIATASALLDKLLAYLPSVITGAVVLIFGMILARFVATLVYITAKNTDMPIPATLSRLTKYAIVVYVTILYLKEIGFVDLFVGANYTIFIGGVIFAMALAFGLAGKDVAAKYLGVLDKKDA